MVQAVLQDSAPRAWAPGDAVRLRLQLVLVPLVAYVLQYLSGNAPFAGLSHWLIPDGQTYHDVVDALATGGFEALTRILPEQFAGVIVNPVLFMYYAPFYVCAGFVGYFIANQLLVQFVASRHLVLGLFLTPYFLLSFALPSKDLMVLALFVPFLKMLMDRRFLAALPIAALIFLVRDGAGVVAVACLLAAIFAPQRPRARLVLLGLGVVAIAILNSLVYEFFGDAFIFARNLQLAEEQGNYDLGGEGASSYLIRLFGNATNLGFRPVFADVSGNVPVLAIAYWLSGVTAIVCAWFSVRLLFRSDTPPASADFSMFFLVSLMVISLNPLVQPRYQLFIVVIMAAHLVATQSVLSLVRTFCCTLLLSGAAALAYVYTGIGLPAAYDWGILTPIATP